MPVTTLRASLAVCCLLLGGATLAHHSRAEFSGDKIELEGALVEISWANPHPELIIRRSGTDELWGIEGYGGASQTLSQGFDPATVEIGSSIVVYGAASGRREHMLLADNVLLPDGLELVLNYNVGPRWDGRAIGGRGTFEIDRSVLARAAAENLGFFRVWSVESIEVGAFALEETERNASYTEAGLAAMESWDLANNPITRCEPSWMPHTMIQPVAAQFIDNGETLTLNNAYYATSRTIYMDGEPPQRPPSRLGDSRGRWEGENRLVIETDNIDAPSFNGNGILQSPQMRIVERFTLSDDQSQLDYRMVMTDPVALNEPAVYEIEYLALGREFRSGSTSGGNCK